MTAKREIKPVEMAEEGTAGRAQTIAGDYWREAHGRIELVAARCVACGTLHLPRVAVCATCGDEEFVEAALAPRGKLYSFTIIRMPPAGYAGEFAVGYVDFPEGVRVFGHVKLVEASSLACDIPVEIEKAELFQRSDGSPVIGYRFVPAAAKVTS